MSDLPETLLALFRTLPRNYIMNPDQSFGQHCNGSTESLRLGFNSMIANWGISGDVAALYNAGFPSFIPSEPMQPSSTTKAAPPHANDSSESFA